MTQLLAHILLISAAVSVHAELLPPGALPSVLDFGAKGDGRTDDTAAINKAFQATATVYFPPGNYLVSDTLAAGTRQCGHRLIGAGVETTKITLKDGAFKKSGPMRAVVAFHSDYPEPQGTTGNAFGNYLLDITIDVGKNPTATAVAYITNNEGAIRNITLKAADRSGSIGIDMRKGWCGPGIIKNVTIEGFDIGIQYSFSEYSMILEDVTLTGQREAGIDNPANMLAIRNLKTSGKATPLKLGGGKAVAVLVDCDFSGGSGTAVENMNGGYLFARNTKLAGFSSLSKGAAGKDLAEFSSLPGLKPLLPGAPSAATATAGAPSGPAATPMPGALGLLSPGTPVAQPPARPPIGMPPQTATSSGSKSLNLPVKDNPIPAIPLAQWVNVADYGARFNDLADDTSAVQAAINAAAEKGLSKVYFPLGGAGAPDAANYRIGGRVRVHGSVQEIDFLFSPINVGPNGGFDVEDGAAPVVVFQRTGQIWGCDGTLVHHKSNRGVHLRDLAHAHLKMYVNEGSKGEVFLENVSCVHGPRTVGPFVAGQRVWGRQVNPECVAIHLHNRGADVWVLGLKTEQGGPGVVTEAGGRTEILGGFIYPVSADAVKSPAFQCKDSRQSFVGLASNAYAGTYENVIEEIRGGKTDNIRRDVLGTGEYKYGSWLVPVYTSPK